MDKNGCTTQVLCVLSLFQVADALLPHVLRKYRGFDRCSVSRIALQSVPIRAIENDHAGPAQTSDSPVVAPEGVIWVMT